MREGPLELVRERGLTSIPLKTRQSGTSLPMPFAYLGRALAFGR
jgi:hypothetical protein